MNLELSISCARYRIILAAHTESMHVYGILYTRIYGIIILQAYEYGIRYPQNVFLFYGWYADNWWVGTGSQQEEYLRTMYPSCTAEQRASVVAYSLAALQAEFLADQNESAVIDSGIVSVHNSHYMQQC